MDLSGIFSMLGQGMGGGAGAPNLSDATNQFMNHEMSEEDIRANIQQLRDAKNPIFDVFNRQVDETLNVLHAAVPENPKIGLALQAHHVLMNTLTHEPLQRWLLAIRGHEDILGDWSRENVKRFLEVAPSIDFIKDLDAPAYWDDFDEDSQKNLWERMKTLNATAQTLGKLNPGIFNEAQSIVGDLDPANLNLDDPGALIDTVLEKVTNNDALLGHVGISKDEINADPAQMAMVKGLLTGVAGNLMKQANQ